MTSSEIVTLHEAAQETGRPYLSLLAAARRGRLDARTVGRSPSLRMWVTTRDDVARYVAGAQLRTAPGRKAQRVP